MESRTKNKKSRETIEGMAKRSFNGIGLAEGEDAITELKEGWFNVAYNIKLADGRETILKIAPPEGAEILTYEKGIMKTEVDMLRLIGRETDVKVPEVYYYDDRRDICDSDYFFMEKIVGFNYEHAKNDYPKETNSKIYREIGQSLRKMNAIKGDYFGYQGNPELRGKTWREAFLKMIYAVLEDGRRKKSDIGLPYEEVCALIENHARCLDSVGTPSFVHWDLWDLNVFVKEGEITGVLDFERVLWGDVLMESIFRTCDPDHLAGYGKTEFTYEESVRNKLYDLYLFLIMRIECDYRHYDTDFWQEYSLKTLADIYKWLKENG